MGRTKRLQLLLSKQEYDTLKIYAQSLQMPMSEVIRDYIKTLTPSKGGRTTSHE